MNSVLFAALLALQASLSPLPAQIMQKAVAKSASDSKILSDKYLYDKTPGRPPKCKNPDDSHVGISDLFGADRYTYALDDTIVFNSRSTYVISFMPKDNPPDSDDGASMCREIRDQSLNHLRGLIYVDVQDFGIARVVAHVNKPPAHIKAVGRLYTMEITIDQFQFNEIWVPLKITVDSDYSYLPGLFAKHHPDHQSVEFSNYRPKAP